MIVVMYCTGVLYVSDIGPQLGPQFGSYSQLVLCDNRTSCQHAISWLYPVNLHVRLMLHRQLRQHSGDHSSLASSTTA